MNLAQSCAAWRDNSKYTEPHELSAQGPARYPLKVTPVSVLKADGEALLLWFMTVKKSQAKWTQMIKTF
jgi:predicted ATPase